MGRAVRHELVHEMIFYRSDCGTGIEAGFIDPIIGSSSLTGDKQSSLLRAAIVAFLEIL